MPQQTNIISGLQKIVVVPNTQKVQVIGATGPIGPTGPGVPIGGTTNQVLSKINSTDYNTQWVTPVLATANNAFTGANTFQSISGIVSFYSASTQDGISILGRNGGTTSLRVSLIPAALTTNKTITLPDATGTIITTGNLTGITTVGTLTAGSIPATLLTGLVDTARISGSYTGLTGIGTLTTNVFINNASPTIYLQDTDNRSSMIHCNSNIFYILRGSGTNSTTYTATGGYWPLEINLENNNAQFGGTLTSIGRLWSQTDLRVGNTNSAVLSSDQFRLSVTPQAYTTLVVQMGEHYGQASVGTGNSEFGIFANDTIRFKRTLGTSMAYMNSNGIYLLEGWFRSPGSNGWYSELYGGGIHMLDTTWVRVYNGKSFYVGGGGQIHNAKSTSWGGTFDTGAYYAYAATGTVNIGFYHVTGTTINLAQSDTTFYFRNSNNTQYVGVAAIIYNQSSRELKQDITNFPQKIQSAGAAVNPLLENDALHIIDKLQPRFYRWDREKTFGDELPRDERRRKALSRLNKIRKEQNLDPFLSDETMHKCGRDCEAIAGDVCNRVKDWELGSIGFIAEEVGEIIPQAARFDMDGKFTSIDSVALNALCVAAIKELKQRLELLEK